ncbi:unnamed protein product [Vitrella brassicaformis CCMP3155]|uniref:Anaphase-promoting complex subunit 4 WD40 domain-containing protein n=2 Tax=Vitrella brassicaformis TaxID=1169539 RepID=A0A0G4G7B8_VITBC|nr:unnamed protein product [Vitrella brassicaformis CCMP3155]|eukprot:CEM24444.1 unnamed protein product [Vitrella brassicaformis CCMP3155]
MSSELLVFFLPETLPSHVEMYFMSYADGFRDLDADQPQGETARHSPLPLFVLRGQTARVFHLSFARSQLLSATGDGRVHGWDLGEWRVDWTIKASPVAALSAHHLAGSSTLLTQGREGQLKLWDLESHKCLLSVVTNAITFTQAVPLSGEMDGTAGLPSVLSPVAEVGSVGLYDLRSRLPAAQEWHCSMDAPAITFTRPQQQQQQQHSEDEQHRGGKGSCMALMPSPKTGADHTFLAAYEDSQVCLWDVRQPKEPVHSPLLAFPSSLSPVTSGVSFLNQCWVANQYGQTRVIKIKATGEMAHAAELSRFPALTGTSGDRSGLPSGVSEKLGIGCICVRRDGAIVAAGGWDGHVQLHEVRTRQLLADVSLESGAVSSCVFHPVNGTLFAGGASGRIGVWDLYADTFAMHRDDE